VTPTDPIHEVYNPADPDLAAARQLYEATIDRATRIPWDWMAGGIGRPRTGRDRWWPHLLLAGDGPATGFVYGSFLPGFGGYACYLGVTPTARGRGIGRRLLESLFDRFHRDAERLVEPMPFIIWESHPPDPREDPNAQSLWPARLRLFARVGALWIDDIDFRVPNYVDRGAPPVKLELFLKPWDTPAEQFDAAALRAVAAGLHRRVYTEGPGDELYERAQDPARQPRLRPATDARHD
jgi:GNAT superfamily N-acetyltransferase